MKKLIALLFVVTPFVLKAQKNFQPGYIVNLKGDTISGFINYKEWANNPTSIQFKTANNDVTDKEFGVNDLRFFNIKGKESYLRAVVKISLHPVKIDNLAGKDTTFKIDTVFLKMLYYGQRVSLLSYADQLKERFYILEGGRIEPEELIMREYLREGSMSLVSEKGYKSQFRNLTYKQQIFTKELSDQIEEAAYEEDDLKKIVTVINKSTNKSAEAAKKVKKAFWFAGAGVQRNFLDFVGDHIMARNPHTSQSSLMPRVSAGIDLFPNPNVGKLFYRIEAGYQFNKSSITTSLPDNEKAIFTLHGSTFSLRTQLNYTVYNTAKIKIPVGAGLVFNYLNYSKNQYKKQYSNGTEGDFVENWLDLKKNINTFFGRASVVLNNKTEISFSYSPTVRLTKTIARSVTSSNIQLQVYYLFR